MEKEELKKTARNKDVTFMAIMSWYGEAKGVNERIEVRKILYEKVRYIVELSKQGEDIESYLI